MVRRRGRQDRLRLCRVTSGALLGRPSRTVPEQWVRPHAPPEERLGHPDAVAAAAGLQIVQQPRHHGRTLVFFGGCGDGIGGGLCRHREVEDRRLALCWWCWLTRFVGCGGPTAALGVRVLARLGGGRSWARRARAGCAGGAPVRLRLGRHARRRIQDRRHGRPERPGQPDGIVHMRRLSPSTAPRTGAAGPASGRQSSLCGCEPIGKAPGARPAPRPSAARNPPNLLGTAYPRRGSPWPSTQNETRCTRRP